MLRLHVADKVSDAREAWPDFHGVSPGSQHGPVIFGRCSESIVLSLTLTMVLSPAQALELCICSAAGDFRDFSTVILYLHADMNYLKPEVYFT